jgi:hypothetical protein
MKDLLIDEFNAISVSSVACKDIIANNLNLSAESAAQFPKIFNPKNSYVRDYITSSYQNKFAKDSITVAEPNIAYDLLRNPQNHYPDKFFSVQGLLHDSKEQSSHMTMGGLKSPSYYILKDCNCSDADLMDKVAKNGEFHQMDIVPNHDEIASSGDALANAESAVKSLGCGENDDIKLPHPEDEFADCKE